MASITPKLAVLLHRVGYSPNDVARLRELDVKVNMLRDWWLGADGDLIPVSFFEAVHELVTEQGFPFRASDVKHLHVKGHRSAETLKADWEEYASYPPVVWNAFVEYADSRAFACSGTAAAKAVVTAVSSPDASFRELCDILRPVTEHYVDSRRFSHLLYGAFGYAKHVSDVIIAAKYLPEYLNQEVITGWSREHALDIAEQMHAFRLPPGRLSELFTLENMQLLYDFDAGRTSKSDVEAQRVVLGLLEAGVEVRKVKALPQRYTRAEHISVPDLVALLSVAPAREVVRALDNAHGNPGKVSKLWAAGFYELPLSEEVARQNGHPSYTAMLNAL